MIWPFLIDWAFVIRAVSNLGSSELIELETFSAELGLPVIMSPTSLVQEIYQI
jgi:hypothetical protein